MRPSEIMGRAYRYRLIFKLAWESIREPLLEAKTEEAVIQVFENDARYKREFVPIAPLVLEVLQDRKFPKRREAQINFLSDSLAGYGRITARSSRDLCLRERMKAQRAHHIIRYGLKIECSCGFKGFSHDLACPNCGANIRLPSGSIIDSLI